MATETRKMTLEEFIAWEETQEVRHEFVDGEVSLFPGGTLRHALLVGRIFRRIASALDEPPYRVFAADTLTRTPRGLRYPDVVVTCDQRDTGDLSARTLGHPLLIVEVLSESTAATDRSRKLDEYRAI